MDEQDRERFERALIGSCFTEPRAHEHYMRAEILSGRGRRVLEAVRAGLGDGGIADPLLVVEHLRNGGSEQSAEDIAYLLDCFDHRIRGTNAPFYADRLSRDWQQRRTESAVRAAEEAIRQGDVPARVMEHLEAAIENLRQGIAGELPEPIDLVRLLEDDAAEPVPWAVKGLFAKGDILVVGGEGGTGKSILALDLSIALATGGQFLGLEIDGPQRVLYLDEENQPHTARRRLRQHLLGREIQDPDGLFYYLHAGHRMDSPEGRGAVSALVDKHEARWVVLDSLIRFIGGDENSNTDAAKFSASLKAERIRSDVGWIVLAHLAKPSKDRPDAVHRVRGAGEFVNSSDALLTLEGDRDTERRTLTPQQRRTSILAPMSIAWREDETQDTAALVCLGSETQTAEDSVLRALRLAETAGVARQDLRDRLESEGYQDAPKALSRALGKLVGQGTVETVKKGRFVQAYLREYSPTRDIHGT